MFGQKKATPIRDGLSKTRPARYLKSDPSSPAGFKNRSGGRALGGKFGQKGMTTEEFLLSEDARKPRPATASGNGEDRSETAETTETASGATLDQKELPELHILNIKERVLPRLLDLIDPEAASQLERSELGDEFEPIVMEVLQELKITLNRREQKQLEAALIDEILGLGPLEVLLKDPTITDIMVNGPYQVYVERNGKLEITDVTFRDDDHVLHVAGRIVNRVGRRVDQTSPLADARLPDGSRVNVVVPPLAVKGPCISIRKFAERPITLEKMIEQDNLSPDMAVILKAAAASRLNIIVSGGTGSGKTTLLNALSSLISEGERIVTIEDAAELKLQQPHVVTLETRPKNLEGKGEITIRDLTINALRMRPDRIILGEIRGPECLDMLQAMNTGHDGSMCTLHANRPREALVRMENMAIMSGLNYPLSAVRTQIAEAIDLIVQIARMRDGMRRITSITEVVGMEGDVVVVQELFSYRYLSDDDNGKMQGIYEYSGLRPHCHEKFREYGHERAVMEALK
jgi:pilus assembly protein CpaF